MAALGTVLAYGSIATDCIDYGDYMHWVGGVGTPSAAHDVAVVGSYAYVADTFSGLQVIEIPNPKTPGIVGSVDTPGGASGVAVLGSRFDV